ncbi:zinc ribbon domain-containing protein [Promethearchaeum syntrophicum]|uniref:Zinc ribbon domain-containing protein n=1 Tax=Promethearchaeum syntrophicum TaxID=2594042 RepID=A0A5B9DCE7_9ARCH|nr:zinc ribbon domain-containing protein [Candidatus Prometheoarchaeum syntrophicum]QEE16547.1 hypothetical protein DSAG12_02377 [Candidatus Prometheoarchaeum syntrophicum]
MTFNSNTAYLQNWENFSLLGNLMKKYSLASLISIGVSIIGSIITFIVFLIPMIAIDYDSVDAIYAATIGMGGVAIFFTAIVGLISIYRFVTHIQFLIQLKNASQSTGDLNLNKVYKMDLWSIIASGLTLLIMIIGVIILSFLITSIGDMDPYSAMSLYFLSLLGFLFVILIAFAITIVFQILSVVAFEKWGQNIKATNFRNRNAINLVDGINFMKFGKIILIAAAPISIIFSYMGIIAFLGGTVMFQIGVMKTGKNIVEFFDGYGNYISTQGTASPQISNINTIQQPMETRPNPTLNPNSFGNPSSGNTTIKPQAQEFCPFCGSTVEDRNTIFCANCGRKLV